METVPFHFYDEPIQVIFDVPPMYEKSPNCPKAFVWREETFLIHEVLEEWVDVQRRGRMDRNMSPAHLASARLKGSWGVSRYYFRIETTAERFFEIYYDRAPENCDDRKGNWYLKGERKPLIK